MSLKGYGAILLKKSLIDLPESSLLGAWMACKAQSATVLDDAASIFHTHAALQGTLSRDE